MFPLEVVLFPGGVLQLHVFEERYKIMMRDVMASDCHFGVVLIERGSEVGGGDVRMGVGTSARVHEAQRIANGRWLVVALGGCRLRVDRWLPDAPYPRAEVRAFPDATGRDVEEPARANLNERMRRVLPDLAGLEELVAPATVDLGADSAHWSFRLADLGPFTELDRQRLLEVGSVLERNALLSELVEEVDGINKLRLKIGEEAGEGWG